MSAAIDQKMYLQKYLTGTSGDKKKKKKKSTKGKGFKIIDDDLDLARLRPLDGDELDILDQGEDAPQIAGIIDERPEEIKKLEQFKTNTKWRVINQDDGFNSKLQIEEIKRDVKDQEKENEIIFGKMYSDSEDEKKKDSDLSPMRNARDKTSKKSNPAKRQNSDSDFSPPRRSDNRESPPKKHKSDDRNNQDPKEPQKNNKDSVTKKVSTKRQNNSDSDFSPPRRGDNRESPPKRHKSENQTNNVSDLSPQRNHEVKKSKDRIRKPSRWGDPDKNTEANSRRRSRDSDMSPPRNSKKLKNMDSPLRKSHLDSESKRKRSPSCDKFPRKSQKYNRQKDYEPDKSTKKRNKSPDSDISPPRKKKESSDNYRKRDDRNRKTDKRTVNSKRSSDSDLSPPRKKRQDSPPNRQLNEKQARRKSNSDSDLSPPRKERHKTFEKDKRMLKRNSDSPPPSNKKMARTLEGKKAGLQDARELRQENESFRRKEDEVFMKMTDEVSGRNAKAVSRKSKRETSEDRQKQKDKAEKQRELDEKYKRWGKGLKQLQDQESRVQDFLHEAAKPLARHKDDKDLEDRLKYVERDGDPMLQYMKEKKRERGELGPEKPIYKGNFPPNRFNLRPGYRWDGVDRSNGYEKKFFDQQSKRKAQEEEAYKWSTEDL